MKAADASPAAYVTSREVPSAWRTRATQPSGHATAARTTVAMFVPGRTAVPVSWSADAIHAWNPLG